MAESGGGVTQLTRVGDKCSPIHAETAQRQDSGACVVVDNSISLEVMFSVTLVPIGKTLFCCTKDVDPDVENFNREFHPL